jgi:hypothetical protein
MELQNLGHLVADANVGIERCHWVLKDHRNLLRANRVQLARCQGQQVSAIKHRLARRAAVLGQ